VFNCTNPDIQLKLFFHPLDPVYKWFLLDLYLAMYQTRIFGIWKFETNFFNLKGYRCIAVVVICRKLFPRFQISYISISMRLNIIKIVSSSIIFSTELTNNIICFCKQIDRCSFVEIKLNPPWIIKLAFMIILKQSTG
jgi:hypothetical protein